MLVRYLTQQLVQEQHQFTRQHLFVFDSPEHAASLFNLQTFGNVYSRISNPTVAILEERVAALEGGRACNIIWSIYRKCFTTLLKNGDEIVSSSSLYGGSYSLFDVTFRQFGINTTFVEPDNIDNFERAITEKTRVIYGETIGNPRGNILDLEKIASIANKYKIPFIVDNTLASPYLCKPISFWSRYCFTFSNKVSWRSWNYNGWSNC